MSLIYFRNILFEIKLHVRTNTYLYSYTKFKRQVSCVKCFLQRIKRYQNLKLISRSYKNNCDSNYINETFKECPIETHNI